MRGSELRPHARSEERVTGHVLVSFTLQMPALKYHVSWRNVTLQ